MIMFPVRGGFFHLRAAGVCVDDGYVLLHRSINDASWALPGGRVEMSETSSQAVVREMREELGLEASAERLLWIAESFVTHGDVNHQELGMYYLLSFPRDAVIYDKTRAHDGMEGSDLPLIFRWFPVEELTQVHVVPPFLRMGLRELPRYPVHMLDSRMPVM